MMKYKPGDARARSASRSIQRRGPSLRRPVRPRSFVNRRLAVTESEIEAAVIKVVAEKMGIDEDDISGDTRFTEDLNADSLDTVELIMDLEDEFEIAIGDEEARKLQTIGDVVELIVKHEDVDRIQQAPH